MAILDGHILLSREQTQMGIYPAVDVPASVSRVMNDIAEPKQLQAAQYFRRLVALYMENRDLILMGGYAPGQDPDLDMAVQLWPKLDCHIKVGVLPGRISTHQDQITIFHIERH